MKLKIFAAFTAACVMAVGLYGQAVESETVTLLGEDYFLSYTNNSTIADMSAYLIENEGKLEVEDKMAVGLWSAGEADMSKVVNNGDVNWLNLDTAGDVVTNSLYAKEDMNYSIDEKGKAVITAKMLMVPSDEIEASFVDGYSTDGTFGFIDNGDLKFGLYAYEYDVTKTVTEGETTTEVVEVVTNLVIYHSYYDTPIPTDDDQLITPVAYTNYVYEVPSNTDFTQPQTVKITLMQAKNAELFFKVTLNDIDVVTPYGCAEATIVNCPDELPYRDGGPWLRCVNNGNVNSISAINFSGTGTINGLTVGTIDANGEGGGEGGDDTEEIILSWNEFAGFADTTVGETATTNVTFNLANANEANVTIAGDSAFAIADQSTLGTVTVTFAPTEAKEYTATLTVTAGDKSETLSITGTGVAAPAPTVISVVKLSGTSSKVNGTKPELTATLTDSNGNVIDAANYTIDTSAIDMTKAGLYPVVITATGDDFQGVVTNYYAVMNLTWFNGVPTQKALIEPQNATLTGVHYMHISQDGKYLAVNGFNGNTPGDGHFLYSVDTLKSLYGTCQGVWEVAHNTVKKGKGMTVNTASGIMLVGGGTAGNDGASQSTFIGYDIGDLANIGNTSNLVEETYTAEWANSGYDKGQVIDGLDFNYAGTKVFGNNAGADGPWVYQLAIDKNAKTMTWEATYTTGFGRVRSVSSYYIDGKDYIFAGEGGSSGRGEIAVIDPSNGSVKTICVAADDFTTEEFPSGRYFTNVKVSGIASGEMYLYGSTDKGEVLVWALGHDAVTGEWMTAPVANITSAQTVALTSVGSISNSRAFEVSDDNTAAFLYVQERTPAHIAVVTDESLARRKALASATLSPTGSNKDVALGEITAAVIDENLDTVDASEYTITTNLIDITTVGEYTVTITPVEGSVYSNAVTAVYTISVAPAAGFNYPEGGAIDDAAVVAWLTGKGATQAQINALGSVAALNEKYLLNLDLEGSSYTLKIKSLTVGEDVKVEVELVRTNGEVAVTAPINGKLQLWGTADLGSDFADCGLTEISNADFSDGTTAVKSFPATGVKFFKAVIVNPTAAE